MGQSEPGSCRTAARADPSSLRAGALGGDGAERIAAGSEDDDDDDDGSGDDDGDDMSGSDEEQDSDDDEELLALIAQHNRKQGASINAEAEAEARGAQRPKARRVGAGLAPRHPNVPRKASATGARPAAAAAGCRAGATEEEDSEEDAQSVEEMIREHNKKFAPKPTYCPSTHSVRLVREWERATQRKWHALGPEGRHTANLEIQAMKDAGRIG